MQIPNLMVHVDIKGQNNNLLKTAGYLSRKLNASVTGIAARKAVQIVLGEGYAFGDALIAKTAETQHLLDKAQAHFLGAMTGCAHDVNWRSTMVFDSLAYYIARESRSADLLLVSPRHGVSFDASNDLNPGDLVGRLGRPLMVVPETAVDFSLSSVLIGWQDTREARRAILDALPLLRLAKRVDLVEMIPDDSTHVEANHLDDILRWLKHHGVQAASRMIYNKADSPAHLSAIAAQEGTDLIVAGAYGHNHIREWILGGETQDLLTNAACCVFLSH